MTFILVKHGLRVILEAVLGAALMLGLGVGLAMIAFVLVFVKTVQMVWEELAGLY